MASAPCSCTTTLGWCAPPGARLSSPTQLRPCRVRTTWSGTTTAGGRVLGTALIVSTRRRTTRSAGNVRPRCAVADDSGVVADDSGVVATGGGGVALAEVVAVEIGNINRQRIGKLYGTITVTDDHGTSRIYNRGKHDFQKVGPVGKAELTYPPRAISAAQHFVIDVDLMDHYSWLPHGGPHCGAGAGDLELAGRLTDAVVAAVEVVVSSSGNSIWPPDVYGSVKARTTMASGEQLEYSLFHREGDQHKKVPEGKAIPLQRKLVSAPLCSKVEVSANLWDANKLATSDDQMVNGSVVFTLCLAGTNTAEIIGPRGKVRVDVTWST